MCDTKVLKPKFVCEYGKLRSCRNDLCNITKVKMKQSKYIDKTETKYYNIINVFVHTLYILLGYISWVHINRMTGRDGIRKSENKRNRFAQTGRFAASALNQPLPMRGQPDR